MLHAKVGEGFPSHWGQKLLAQVEAEGDAAEECERDPEWEPDANRCSPY